jgi:hypothetical protein
MKKDISGTDKKIIKEYLEKRVMREDVPVDWNPFSSWDSLHLLLRRLDKYCWGSTEKDVIMYKIASKVCDYSDFTEDELGFSNSIKFRGIFAMFGADPEIITRAIYETYMDIEEKVPLPSFNTKRKRELREKVDQYNKQIIQNKKAMEMAQEEIERIQNSYEYKH